MIRIYADFNGNEGDRVPLDTVGSTHDLALIGNVLQDGLDVVLYMDDGDDEGNSDNLEVDGRLFYDKEAGYWIGVFDPDGFRHASETWKGGSGTEHNDQGGFIE